MSYFFSSLYSNAHSFLLRCFYFGHDWLKRSRFCAHTTMKKAKKKKKKTKEMWSSISLIMTCIQVVRYYFGRCCGNNLKQNDMRSLEHNLIWWLYGNLVIASHTITVITPHTHTHIYFLVWIVGFWLTELCTECFIIWNFSFTFSSMALDLFRSFVTISVFEHLSNDGTTRAWE